MIVPVLLLCLSAAGLAVALILPGWTDLLLLAIPSAIASLVLLLKAALGRQRIWLMIDGSNVIHWKGGQPDIATLIAVIDHVCDLGYTPLVIFDANVGYKLDGRYLNDRALASSLGLPVKHVQVMPKGQPADPAILAASRKLDARIVTNDRFRDWQDSFPEIEDPGHLVRGGYRTGRLRLDLQGKG